MPRSPLTESIQKVRRLVTEIQGTLTVDEFNLLLDELVPEPEPEVKRAKKTRKKSSTSKSSQSSSKSPRASGIHAQLKERRQEQREPMTTKDDSLDDNFDRCMFSLNGKWCHLLPDHNIHHLKTHPNYHEFESGKSTAPPAPAPSPANGESSATERSTRRPAPPSTPETYDERGRTASLSTAGLEASAANVGVVTGGSGE